MFLSRNCRGGEFLQFACDEIFQFYNRAPDSVVRNNIIFNRKSTDRVVFFNIALRRN